MAKVFSWKVAPEKYSYLVKDDSTNSYIRNKITDSNILHTMANIVNGWSEGEYSSNYNSMKAEVKSVYGEGVLPEDYREYWNISNITEGTVVLLSGKDGRGGGGNYGGGDDGSTGGDYFLDETDYKALIDKIEKEFEAQRNALEAKIEQLKTELARIASDSVGEAWNDIYDASERLNEIEDRLREAAENAANALDFFRNLSSGGTLTYQDIINIFNQTTEFNNWYNDYGSGITRMYSGYTQFETGLVGEFADGLEGAWGVIGTHLNSLSGTVGTVESRIDAAEATISDVATWYNLSADTISEVKRTIDAKIGLIEDAVSYIENDLETFIVNKINGMAGTITTNIDTRYDEAINNIQQELNGLSASVSTKITHYDTLEGRLARVEEDMNASAHGDQANYTKAVTIAESAWTHADQMRETWSQASGMLRTVSDLSIKQDEDELAIYWYIDPEDEDGLTNKTRVYYIGKNSSGDLLFTNRKGTAIDIRDGRKEIIDGGSLAHGDSYDGGVIYTRDVYPDYVTNAFSFIQQTSDHIDMGVFSGRVKASLEMAAGPDASKIYLGADKILLDGQVIASSLTANQANIGGVLIGRGEIKADNTSNGGGKWAITSAGTISATNADIKGIIRADQLILGDTYGVADGSLTGFVNTYVSGLSGVTSGTVDEMISQRAQICGWTATEIGSGYVRVDTTIGQEGWSQSSFTITSDGLMIAKNGIFSGTVFATNGVFNGKVYAKEGEFAGSISATNGYFKGKIEASDIVLSGQSLRMYSGSTNNFEIGNNIIDVKYIPQTVQWAKSERTVSGRQTDTTPTSTNSVKMVAQFITTGNTENVIPPVKLSYQPIRYGGSISQLQDAAISVQHYYQYALCSGLTHSDYDGLNFPSEEKWLYGSSGNYGQPIIAETQISSPTTYDYSLSSNTLHNNTIVKLASGITYMLLCQEWVQFQYNPSQNDIATALTLTLHPLSFINNPDLSNQQFFNIGRNGMQIALGGSTGLYFTAARRQPAPTVPIEGWQPIIAMGGKNQSGKMFGLKMDSDGIKILRGDDSGWVDL